MAAEGGSAAIKREDVPIWICSKEGGSEKRNLTGWGDKASGECFLPIYVNRESGLLFLARQPVYIFTEIRFLRFSDYFI